MTTIIIIVITVIVTIYAWRQPHLYQNWMMNPYAVSTRKQYYRFLTSGFIHINYMHLGFNMLTFYFFAGRVESEFNYGSNGNGTLLFVIFYLAAIIISEIPTFFKNRNKPQYNSLGASGGVAAVVFSSILYSPTVEICLYLAICIPGFILGILYLIYSYYMGRKQMDNINHDAHLYGALFGIVFTLVIDPNVLPAFVEQLSGYVPFR
ncbi:rhomboid family intramembrane serine protease [Fulvivirgaceae bacterium BMA10]|uniref:Rhomboid family intramembrane serine protease n=1 Tax=Splendidivirga corallicola TaxID=3051826 RepID=A0ABT8KWT7_9BACT|nr:rhomboid family intramembrane serine protease [Fulvivirgaceae bacterium BMA10]